MYEKNLERPLDLKSRGYKAYAEECQQTMLTKHKQFHQEEVTMHMVVVLKKAPTILGGEEVQVVRYMMKAPVNVLIVGNRDELCEYFKTANFSWHMRHRYGPMAQTWIRKYKWRTKTITENRLEKIESFGSVLAHTSLWHIVKTDTPVQVLDLSDRQINRVLRKLGAEILDVEDYGGYGDGKLEEDFDSIHDMFEHTRFPRHLRVQYRKQQIVRTKAEQKFLRSIWSKHYRARKKEEQDT